MFGKPAQARWFPEKHRGQKQPSVPGRLAETRQPDDDVTCRWEVKKSTGVWADVFLDTTLAAVFK